MAVNKNALIRYKTLDKCFSNPYRKYYIDDLIEECSIVLRDHYGDATSVSRRQILYDMEFMESDAGYEAPIIGIKDGRKKFYRYEDPNFTIQNKPLNQEEQLALENTLELLSRMKGIPGIDAIENIEAKLNEVKDNKGNQKLISFEESEFLIGLEHLTPLYNFIKNNQTIKIVYQSFKTENEQEFCISPYHLKQFNKRWFLFGWNHKDQYLQNLALDRIQGIEINKETYIPTEVDFDEYFEDIIGVSNNIENKLVSVRIELSEHIIPYIKSKPIHGSQKIAENRLQIKVKLNYELESLILSYGENMKVIEPIELVQRLKERIEKLKDFY
ncbi:WYL domain-containing protein [Empedobacter falsenii]